MASAWIGQDPKQVKKYGEEKASFYLYWLDPEGKQRCKSCGPGPDGRRAAKKLKRQVEAQLLTGTYQSNLRKEWKDFRAEYEATVLPRVATRSREEVKAALDHFERLANPKRMSGLKADAIDRFIAARRQERGKKRGSTVSAATTNKTLRHLRAAFKKAKKWGYLAEVPDFDFEREPKKLPRYVTPDDFAKLYGACGAAALPEGLPYPAADWWRGLFVYIYLSGWRIGEVLALPRADLDLKAGQSITRHDDNKGKRDEMIPLHPVLIEHLAKLAGFSERVFPWPIDGNLDWKKELYAEFAKIQDAAGIRLHCPEKHEHTAACRRYGFHDLRRAFATMNAAKLTPDALQALMRHRSYTTTQKYIAMARQLDEAVAKLHVPEVLRKVTG